MTDALTRVSPVMKKTVALVREGNWKAIYTNRKAVLAMCNDIFSDEVCMNSDATQLVRILNFVESMRTLLLLCSFLATTDSKQFRKNRIEGFYEYHNRKDAEDLADRFKGLGKVVLKNMDPKKRVAKFVAAPGKGAKRTPIRIDYGGTKELYFNEYGVELSKTKVEKPKRRTVK